MLNQPGKSLVVTVADIMTRDVVSIAPETPIEKVIQLFTDKNFSGVPVAEKDGTLLGIVTQYDLVIKGSGIHIPTLVKTLEGVNMVQAEKMVLEETLAPIKKLTAKDIMNTDPLSVTGDAPIEDVVLSFAEHHKVNPLIVVDDNKKLIGVVSRHDLIKILAMKELGHTVNAAIERTARVEGGAEAAVAGTIRGVRKEFFFMPKYGAKKWVFLGVAIFIIGLTASFLFIVKLPSGNKVENISIITVPIGEGATLSLKTLKTAYGVGEEIPVDMYLSVKSGNVGVSKVGVAFPQPSGLFFTKFIQEAEEFSNFLPELEILDIKNSSLLFIFAVSSSGHKTSPGETFYLGTAVFRATGPVQADINPSFSGPRTANGSFVEEDGGTEILDIVSGASFVIH